MSDETIIRRLWQWCDPTDMGYLDDSKRARFMVNFGLLELKWHSGDGSGRMKYDEFRQALMDLGDEQRRRVFTSEVATQVTQGKELDVVATRKMLFNFFDPMARNSVEVIEVRRFFDLFRLPAQWTGVPQSGTLNFDQFMQLTRDISTPLSPEWDDVVSGYRALYVFVAGSEGATMSHEDSQRFLRRLRVEQTGHYTEGSATRLSGIADLMDFIHRLQQHLPAYIRAAAASVGKGAVNAGVIRKWRYYNLTAAADPASVLLALFNFFDVDGTGTVDATEVRRFADSMDVAWPSGVPTEGALGPQEFVRIFRDLWVTNLTSDEVMAGFRHLWTWADLDRSGKLDPQERVRFMLRLGLKSITWTDKDRDGQMNFSEFWNMCEEMYTDAYLHVFAVAGMLGKRRVSQTRIKAPGSYQATVTSTGSPTGSPGGSPSRPAATVTTSYSTEPYAMLYNFFDPVNQGYFDVADCLRFCQTFGLRDVVQPTYTTGRISPDGFRSYLSGWSYATTFQRDDALAGLNALWSWADKDGSGKLDPQERLRFMLRLGLREISWPDMDRDALMSFDEFYRMILGLPLEQQNHVLGIGALLAKYGNVRVSRGTAQAF
eukprot:NODE_37_length_2189_cov_388.744423_g36_i0.p1 GENE.NODE_37_length_2189_cov_388.744423_g36_i0~~NODE_37_length_2189_cov_388.744423_g36_i0.p1  ORF type:complete len:602 (+),score=120.93 NODE_37_length_2189_cov_388.744423_g36_i0:78-1883(+)